MAVPVQTPYQEYTANGSTRSFALEFDCDNQDHLIVLVDGIEPVVGTWSLSGGAVVFGTAPASGKKITIQRNTPFRRDGDFQSYDNSFRPGPVNKGLDKVWWKIQELGVADWLLGLKIQKFRDDVNLTALEETLERAREIRDDTAASVVEVQSNVDQSTILLASTIAKAEAAATSATNADTAKVQAEIAATDATTQASTLKIYVDAAVGAISTDASKQYATLALAEADISNIALNKNVFISEAVNGGYWYKATAWATSLTKSPFDPVLQANNSMNANPLFKPMWLTSGQDVHNLNDGLYRFTATVGATLLNLPFDMGTFKAGTIHVDRDPDVSKDRAIAKMSVTLYYDANEIKTWEKTGNGGSTGFTWLPWQKQVSRYEYELNKTAVSNSIATMGVSKAEINLFPNFALTSESSSTYQATLADESGYPTLTLNTSGVTLVAYDMNVVPNILDVGRTVSFSAEGFCNVANINAGDLTIQALSSSGAVLSTSVNAYITTANAFQKITTTLTLPVGTTKLRLRMINRNGAGNTICKFRNATLISDYVFLKYVNPAAPVNNPSSIFHVSKTGNDNNSGLSSASAFLTLQKAINSLPSYGGVIEVGGGFYRDTATVSSKGNVWIRSKRNERAVLFGSDQLIVSKSVGYTQVYQAPLAAKPVGMGGGRGKPVIFEWGTLSKPILDADRQHLHKSRTHRLPYTEMFEATSLAELDTVGGRGKWWWESGIIYFAATDGSDATLKPYEARVRPTIVQNDGVLHMTRIDSFFSTAEGGLFRGIMVDREDCRTFGNYFNGWSDNCNITKGLYDVAGGNGNDGINGTVTSYNVADVNTRLIAHYVEPHVHDNGDDGLSYHYRGNVRITGGVGESNTKADFVHVTGATCVCDGTVSQNTLNGFYAATTATGDTERTASYFKCINTKARNNTYSYRAADDAVMECENTKAINPTGYGYYQTGAGAINALDCKYSGDPSKKKSGTVNVTNTESLT